jgi:diadenosine tetraphosphate (Ap4A) HIT family hydrolase
MSDERAIGASPASPPCLLCERIDRGDTTHANDLAVVIRDAFPLSPGHSLVMSRRHVAGFFDLDADEQAAILELVNAARRSLDEELRPDGYNVGVNVGAAGGQTIPHVHVHVIPRYEGDVPDPRGGIRWIFPDRARYWS